MSRHALYPVTGGHVTAWTWEQLKHVATAACVACAHPFKRDGDIVAAVDLCPGWQAKPVPEMPVLPDLVRGMTREAPDDKPNGPSEEAILNLHEKQIAAIGPHDGTKMIVSVARSQAVSDAVGRLNHALADDARALRLALEHDERWTR